MGLVNFYLANNNQIVVVDKFTRNTKIRQVVQLADQPRKPSNNKYKHNHDYGYEIKIEKAWMSLQSKNIYKFNKK